MTCPPLLVLPAGVLAAVRIPGIGSFGFFTGSGNVVERDVPVSGFNRVRLAGLGNLHIEQGEEESLHIQGEDNILDVMRIEVTDGELYIGFQQCGSVRPSKPLHFYLKAKVMEGISISGAGKVEAGDLKGEHLKLSISGSGNIETAAIETKDVEMKISGSGDLQTGTLTISNLSAVVSGSGDITTGEVNTGTADLKISGAGNICFKNIQARELESKVTGHGNIQLGGRVEKQEISISGSGDIKAFDLHSLKAEVGISGIGNAELRVEEELNARVSGAGNVRYRGQPRVEMKASGIGKISQVRD